ncbi:hypothetical protein Fmac_004944 [Flemingia macrophylla]|uniref:Uncharacterized protein n=1 Tax=Flemingia macrophylla TaxID=520843 RepID=A0ABD1N6C4_9FABA
MAKEVGMQYKLRTKTPTELAVATARHVWANVSHRPNCGSYVHSTSPNVSTDHALHPARLLISQSLLRDPPRPLLSPRHTLTATWFNKLNISETMEQIIVEKNESIEKVMDCIKTGEREAKRRLLIRFS